MARSTLAWRADSSSIKEFITDLLPVLLRELLDVAPEGLSVSAGLEPDGNAVELLLMLGRAR